MVAQDAGGIGAGDGDHGVGAVGGQVGQLILQREGSQAQQRGEHGHGGHEHGGQQGGVAGGLFVLGGLEPGNHLGAGQEGAEIVEDVTDDGGPADLGEVQLLTGELGGDSRPAAGALEHDGGGDGETDQDDDELDQVGDLVSDHAAQGGVQDDDDAGENQAHVQGDGGDQGVDDAAGSRDLGGGQAEQAQHGQDGREVAGELAEPTAHHLRDGDGQGLADLGREVGQGDHGDGSGEHVPDGAHAPVAKGFLSEAGGAAAADVVGGQGESHHEEAHPTAGDHVVLGVLDLQLADDEAHDQHADEVCRHDNERQDLDFHTFLLKMVVVAVSRERTIPYCFPKIHIYFTFSLNIFV